MKPATNDRPREVLQDIKRRSLAGVGALFRRQVIIKASFFLGNIIFARICFSKDTKGWLVVMRKEIESRIKQYEQLFGNERPLAR